MDRNEFIDRIVSRHRLQEDEARFLKQDYIATLKMDTDFDSLFQAYLDEYNFNVAPKPAWFKQRAKIKQTSQSGNYEIRDLIVKFSNGVKYQFAYIHPLESELEAIEGIKERFKDKAYRLFRIKKEYDTKKDDDGHELGWRSYEEEIRR